MVINEMKIVFVFHDDVSSLSRRDIEAWIWNNVKPWIVDWCVTATSIKITVNIDDIIQLNNDLVSMQYQVME